jgi:alkanesulfonate monooxygenase SsuD/methylene tetrahydromethanopterin reductase-like flavin-dependent oxidoreductase (luciferase family)
MKVGLLLDLRNPPAWQRGWPEHYRRTLALAKWADELGIDAFWLTEHHFFGDGYLSQPLVFAAALAAQTARARIGTAVLLGPIRHPVHIAEEAAIVDLVSGGRLELGIGAGYAREEFESFGVERARRMSITDDTIREVQRQLLPGGVDPPAVQSPVPLWAGYLGPRNANRAGRLGVGLMSLSPQSLAPYLEGLREGGHEATAARMAGVIDIVVADDPEAAWPRIVPHDLHQINSYRVARARGEHGEAELLTEDDLADPDAVSKLAGLSVRLQVLTPEAAVRVIRERTAGLPVEHVYVWASIAGMPDDLVERNIELVCSAVAPALR